MLIGSHKGGTGQTTSVLALAHRFGRLGRKVLIWDADPLQSAGLIACLPDGTCNWPNVQRIAAGDTVVPNDHGYDITLIDGPALTDSAVRPLLRHIHGVVLTALADPLSLRTVKAAGRALQEAKVDNPGLALLGMLVCMHTPEEALQGEMLALLRKDYARLLLEPPVPFDASLSEWPLEPGTPPPDGPGADAYGRLAEVLLRRLPQPAAAPTG